MEKISKRQLERLPLYLKYLYSLDDTEIDNVSAPMIASALGLSTEQVRKDIQLVSSSNGKPKQGRNVKELIEDLVSFLGYNEHDDAVVIGVGHLGQAFMNYKGFEKFGLNIVAGFDVDSKLIGTSINNKKIYDLYQLDSIIHELGVKIAILTVPSEVAQVVTNRLVNAGIKAIWNFVPTHLDVSEDIVVENVNLASSLAILSHKLKKID